MYTCPSPHAHAVFIESVRVCDGDEVCESGVRGSTVLFCHIDTRVRPLA
jgi:hypothetical protein